MAKSPSSNDRKVGIVFPTLELKHRFEAEAKLSGHSASEHGALIIANHLEGKSLDRVHEEMAELTTELARFRQSFDQHRRAVFFALSSTIENMPNGAAAARVFEDSYMKQINKGD